MFENIIGLQEVTQGLGEAIAAKTLPPAILLAGPRYGGKSTLALEIARVLTCQGEGKWDCPCRSCSLHRTISHPDLVLIGPRYFELEIAAALRAFETEPRVGTLFLVVRAVRKLVRRFDAHLWSDARLKKVQPALDAVESVLQEMEPPPGVRVLPDDHRYEKEIKQLRSAVAKMVGQVPREIVPVDLVRAFSSWAHISSAGGTKVIVIEEAHTLQDSARNSMLKLLEEPPGGVYLILTSSRTSAIIPTILSRVRRYPLPDRSGEEELQVMEKIFRSAPEVSLSAFFRGTESVSGERRRVLADRIVRTALTREDPTELLPAIQQEFAAGNGGTREEFFFEELTEAARRRLKNASPPEITRLHRWGPVIRTYRSRIETRNMNPASTISALVLALHRDSAVRER